MIQDGIIITFPVQFLLDLAKERPPGKYTLIGGSGNIYRAATHKDHILFGFKECMRQLEAVRTNPDDNIWNHSIGSKPIREVLYAYITILGKIRYRANIAAWEPGGEKQFSDGRKRTAKHWLILSDLVKAPNEIECKGFQGFRYTEKLF